jgi:SPX domain protein involved in polyphosphate accumulation
MNVLMTACEELYRGLDFLKEYRLLNYTAFVKILKKHDKRARQPATAALPVMARVLKAPFFISTVASSLCTNLESAYMRVYTGGDLRKALR